MKNKFVNIGNIYRLYPVDVSREKITAVYLTNKVFLNFPDMYNKSIIYRTNTCKVSGECIEIE